MVDFQLDEMQEMLRDLAHEFAVDEVRPHAEHWDADEVYPIDAIRAAHEMGLLNLHIPEAYGGPGLGCMEEVLVNEELAWGDPGFATAAYATALATAPIITGATEAQKQVWLRKIAEEGALASYAVTEPGAGSDVAAITTTARRDGDEYVINGSKIWTTLGNYADHMILLARTDPTAQRKYDGLSFFLSPMKVPGVDAVPIRKVTGEYGFNQVFFTDTRIPAETLMLGEGQGWGVAMKTLEYERGVSAGQATGHWMVSIEIDDLIDDLRGFERDGAPLFEDPAVRDQAVGLIMEAKALSLSARRMGLPALTSDFPMGLPLSSKYRGTEWARRMKLFGAAMQGARSALYIEDDDAHRGGFWQRAYFSNFGATIGGGTSQVQANIIAEHVLGLPK